MIARVRGPTAASSWDDVEVVGAELDVDEHRHEPVLDDRVDRRREAGGDGDHLVARLRAGARRASARSAPRRASRFADEPELHEQRVAHADGLRELALEPLREATGRQPEVERRVDEVQQLVRVEDPAGDRHRRLARHERARREPGVVVLRTSSRMLLAQVFAVRSAVSLIEPP